MRVNSLQSPRGAHSELVLVVDDDIELLELVRLALGRVGYVVWTAASGPKALDLIEREGLPDLAVVDLMMPGMDGLSFCKALLQFSDLPILVLTAVADDRTRISCLEGWADDYVIKPFNPAELAARVRALLRRVGRPGRPAGARLRVDDRLVLALSQRRVVVCGESVPLTSTENKILDILLRNNGNAVSVNYLARRLWPDRVSSEDGLRVNIHRLRQKIELDPNQPRYLLTERGQGYRFVSG